MKVRGAALISLQSFILTSFGPERYGEWLKALPEESRKIFNSKLSLDEWYPLHAGLHHPTEILCNMFYRGKPLGAWESGRYSADFGMNTLMKVFLKVSSVSFIVKKATAIITRYYEPCKVEVTEEEAFSTVVRISDFDEMTTIIEHRIAGYMERAVELTGGRDANVFIGPSLTKANLYSEFKVQWK